MARKRMALARSRRLGVVMGGKSREAAPGDSRAAHCPTPPRRSKNVGRGYVPDARDRRARTAVRSMWTKAKRLHWSGSARRNDVGAGWECPWGRMSPGAGLWPTPPPLFRPQGHSHPRPTFTVLQRHKAGSFSFPAACDPTPRPPVSQNGQSRFGRQGRSPDLRRRGGFVEHGRSEEHTSELQSLMRISYAVFCLKKKNKSTQY